MIEENIGFLLDIIRLIVGVLILGYASYTDIKTRRASNMLWIIMATAGGFLLIIQYLTIGFNNPLQLLMIPLMIGFAYILFQLRLIFGGADAKAIMALSILAPFHPTINNELPLWSSMMPFPWIIFSNSIILFLIIPLALLLYNIAKHDLELPYCLLGYKMSIDKAKKTFVWPLEQITNNGMRRFVYMPKDFDIEEELKEFEKRKIQKIWVTPKIPFMIPLLIGFITSFTLGDILFHLMNSII